MPQPLVDSDWDAVALNDHRLAWLQSNPKTRYSLSGVMAIDYTLVDHCGKLIEDVGSLWDHAHQRHVIAHDYLNLLRVVRMTGLVGR